MQNPIDFSFIKSNSKFGTASSDSTKSDTSSAFSGLSFVKTSTPATSTTSGTSTLGGFSFNFTPNTTTSSSTSSFAPSDSTATKQFSFEFPKNLGVASTTSTSSESTSTAPKPTFDFGNFNSGTSAGGLSFNFSGASDKLKFNFGTGKDFQAEKSEFSASPFKFSINPISASSFVLPAASGTQPKDEESQPDEIKEAFVEAKMTGEEDEEILLNIKAKVYVTVKEENKVSYVERGEGDLHFNHNKEKNFYRIIMRRSNIGTVVMNQRVFPEMNPTLANKTSLRFLGQVVTQEKKEEGKKNDEAEGADKKKEVEEAEQKKEGEEGEQKTVEKMEIVLLKVKDEPTAKELLDLMKKAIAECE